MDEAAFRRILTTFADTPADITLGKGTLMLQMHEEIISASVFRRDNDLYVDEQGAVYPARQWLVERIARLPMLAERILSYVPAERYFVRPHGRFLDEIENAQDEQEVNVEDALDTVTKVLERHRVWTGSVLYLVSDAGEGKTTVINALARQQAEAFRRRQSSWLVVPVSLGGRSFLRFDDVVAAALLNRFRFPLFFDAFVELVRLGVLVPALDGFEEMFVEGAAGDAASALGNLVRLLESQGSVLVAARQAYFDYKNLDTQSRLHDALAGQPVSFSRMRLSRWTRSQFVAYAQRQGLNGSEHVYEDLSGHLLPDHPLLTRAVLIRRLVELLKDTGDCKAVIERLDRSSTDHFGQLVGPILTREANIWVDKTGEPLRPLLSVEEHYELLETLALEMWLAEASVVPAEMLEWAAELYCEGAKKNAQITRQVVERIKQHALIVNRDGGGRGAFQFDHEEFYHYFLGRAVAREILSQDESAVRAALRRTSLPGFATETAGMRLARAGSGVANPLPKISRVCRTEPAASFVRENAGALIARAIDGGWSAGCTVENLVFPRDALAHRHIVETKFEGCEFAETEVGENSLSGVSFERCRFDTLYLMHPGCLHSAQLIECDVRAAAGPGGIPTYDPREVHALLHAAGAQFGAAEQQELPLPVTTHERDDRLFNTERMVRRFIRSTEVNENTVRQAVGGYAGTFLKEVLPQLMSAGVVRKVQYQGAGQQDRYRLGMPLSVISENLKRCSGSFDAFLSLSQDAR